ncbi:MAG TPA: TIGR01459 family HAD-type hydrolase [Rhizomicrobium sp.]|nr:TIGR01459 family HAD-type hydrolase [Rhizomicrobium sp.]
MHPAKPVSRRAPAILAGLREIAQDYDAAFCDVWGVLHDGRSVRTPAVEALRKFRERRGPVILLSNAPRPVSDVEKQFARLGISHDCYDAILTSGVLAHDDLARRSHGQRLRLLHIGPERDRGVFAGLPIDCVPADRADLVLCTGLFDDDTESPEDYRQMLTDLCTRRFPFLCVNPDIVVQRGGQLVYCAGALARLYEQLGGRTLYYGKPHRPIYDAALKLAVARANRADLRVLVLGDGLETDVRGANAAGLDAVFIAGGIHGENIRELTEASVEKLCGELGVFALAAIRTLVW